MIARPVEAAEAELLLEMARAFHDEDGSPLSAAGEATIGAVAAGVALAPAFFLVEDDEPIGFFILSLGHSVENGGTDGFIDDFYLVPDARGHGLGRQALALAIAEARIAGIRVLLLEVEARLQPVHQRRLHRHQTSIVAAAAGLNADSLEPPAQRHIFLGMKTYQPIPAALADALADTTAFLTPQESQQLWHAAILMADSRGLMVRLTAMFGRRIEALRARAAKTGERIGGLAWTDLVQRAQDAVEDTLWSSYDFATTGLAAVPRIARPKAPRGNSAHRLVAAASGVASGFVGLPGVLFDIPFTTTTILRSIGEVARDNGEDLADEDTKRACLEVLAYGSPNDADDETEIGYWATRIGTNHLAVNLLIRSAAGRFGLVLSEKFLTQAIPVIGAITGGALNYAFTEYYQQMAQVHFCLRALDRRTHQPEAVRAAFATMVAAARDRRRISRKPGAKSPLMYLPKQTAGSAAG